jgi:DNA polymerase I-like protein with 3'-5' exonuclease and polymerase domains
MASVRKAEIKVNPVQASGLFAATMKGVSAFTLKPQHLRVLFIDILKLKPLGYTESGSPQIDKDFLAEYKERIPEAGLVAQISEASKLLNTYCKTWLNKHILGNIDSASDHFLRSAFSFSGVVTGRLSSWDPNQTNLPSRGKLAKVIKRMFVAPPPGSIAVDDVSEKAVVGCVLPRYDASAHEIRIWANTARDAKMAELFRMGYELRQQLIKTPTQEIRDDLKKRGDLHIYGFHMMNGRWIDKASPERDAQKSVVFGAVYGKSARTLGKDLLTTKLKSVKARIKEIQKELLT